MALAHDPELDAQLYTLAFDAEPALDTLPSLSGARLLIAANDESLDPIVRQRAAILYLQRRADAQAGLVKSSPEDYERDHPFSELSRRELMLLSAAVLLKPLDFTLPDHDLRYAAGWQLLLTIFNPANGDVDFVKSAQRLFTKNAIDYQTRRNTGQLPLTDFPPPESTPMLLDSPIPSLRRTTSKASSPHARHLSDLRVPSKTSRRRRVRTQRLRPRTVFPVLFTSRLPCRTCSCSSTSIKKSIRCATPASTGHLRTRRSRQRRAVKIPRRQEDLRKLRRFRKRSLPRAAAAPKKRSPRRVPTILRPLRR